MREIIIKKIEELSADAQDLVEQREQAIKRVQEIEVRLHQIAGAISEIDKMLKSQESKDEASKAD